LLLGHVVGLDRLGDCADLVHLEEKSVACLLLDSSGNSVGVGDEEVVADNLDCSVGGQLGVAFPVVLVEGVSMERTG